ncbi:MAG TPA: o-succinylbenzoate synthase [Salinimicrobium sp.]|nr:o-succinylbenzoate synthase [Salinimicrobium sp.]
MTASYHSHFLDFKRPSGTSRGILTQKETWFLKLTDGSKTGIGECGILRGLSIDDRPDYEEKLKWTCENIKLGPHKLWKELKEFPSIQFGVEMAFKAIAAKKNFILFPSEFTEGRKAIPINGLVWMGDKAFMKTQIIEKINEGFNCIKLKIGAIDFETELNLLKYIRSQFSSEEIEIRVDANGAFHPSEALKKLFQLQKFDLHSIEQPIKAGQIGEMAKLCQETPVPIALDEELIGIFDVTKKEEILQMIRPQFIICKPSLIGGFKGTQQWLDLAEKQKIGWWITSALESNVGLNAISQWTYTLKSKMPQGLGTGSLYINNFPAPLTVEQGKLKYHPDKNWQVNI